MNVAGEAQERIEGYLKQVQEGLRGLRNEQVVEITTELRSHIMERSSAAGELTANRVSVALKALGTPEELARAYAADEVLARAEVSRTPLRLLDSLFRWASMSLAGFLLLMATLAGYFLGLAFVGVALLKPFHPAAAGLWSLSDQPGNLELSLRMGFGPMPAHGHELLGWWIVPLGVGIGCGLVMATTQLALWCVRMYRQSHALR